MKTILLSIGLVLAVTTTFAATQTGTTQDKPWRVYLLGGTMNTSDNDNSIETDYYYPNYPQSALSLIADSSTTSAENIAWVNGLGGGGSGTVMNNSITEGFYPPGYTNDDNSLENDAINLDWSGAGSQYQNVHKWGADTDFGADYGAIDNYDNTNASSWPVTISSYVGNEHCDVTDSAHPPFRSYGEDAWNIGLITGQITQTETYQRYAQASWHVQTGGKAMPGRQNLWQFTGSAQEVLNKRAGPPSYGAGAAIPSGQITMGSLGNLGADGNLWIALPDGVDKDITPTVAGEDFYTFSVGGQKYPLTITANGNDLSVTNPEFCVGQQVNFAINWIQQYFWQPGQPPYVNMVGNWSLPAKYVNDYTNTDDDASDDGSGLPDSSETYFINDDLLQNTNQTSCWFVNGTGGNVSVGLNLQFSNGQYVNIAAVGQITVYRPTFSSFLQQTYDLAWSFPNLNADMSWQVDLDSKYDGQYGITQLLLGTGVYYGTGGDYVLDGDSEIYGEVNANGPSTYTASLLGTHVLGFQDSPGAPTTSLNLIFKDYLRFMPAGNNSIYVTIATNGWSVNASVNVLTGVLTPTNIPPAISPVDSDEFPEWIDFRPE